MKNLRNPNTQLKTALIKSFQPSQVLRSERGGFLLSEGDYMTRIQGAASLLAFKQYSIPGVFVGGCVARGIGSSFRARAHAHTHKLDPNRGWICVRGWRRVFYPDGRPSNTMLHELAHILTWEGHTDKFRSALRQLGAHCTMNAKKRHRHKWKIIGAHSQSGVWGDSVKCLCGAYGWKRTGEQ